MVEEEYILAKLNSEDKEEVELLALENDGGKKLTAQFIQHWYFNNPSHSYSFWKVVVNNKIEGFATTNNFRYSINGNIFNVAMPQNVLTSGTIRGKGLFIKLYFKTESHNLKENNISVFLTFTNALSTPIFLNKFNYVKGKCPIVIFNPLSILSFFKKKNFERLKSIDAMESSFFEKAYHFDNAMQKNERHYKWRYSDYTKRNLHILKVSGKESLMGYAFLKEESKKGIKFLVIMDIVAMSPGDISNVIESCFNYSSRKLYFGTMTFDLPGCKIKNGIMRLKINDRFNFLVKGKDTIQSEVLSNTDFNMFFGDMDIV